MDPFWKPWWKSNRNGWWKSHRNTWLKPSEYALPLEQAIRDALWTSATQQGRRPVLVLDEAHGLTVPLLNTLRRLLNFARDTTAPLALILAGHTELRQQLA